MRIGVIGGGSIGLLLTSYLAEHFDCTLVVKRQGQVEEIIQNGIRRVTEENMESIQNIHCTTKFKELEQMDLIIVAVKFAHIPSVLEQLAMIQMKGPLLFIQNGIGHVKLIEQSCLSQIIYGTIEHGALKVNNYTVSHNGVGPFIIGKNANVSLIEDLLQASSTRFPIQFVDDAEQMLFRKVIINCMINPLTTITFVQNGQLLTNPHLKKILHDLFEEFLQAFPEIKQYLSIEDIYTVCKRTANNHSSMLTDRIEGRPMEIHTIVTAVIEKAAIVGQKLPLLSMLEGLLWAANDIKDVEE